MIADDENEVKRTLPSLYTPTSPRPLPEQDKTVQGNLGQVFLGQARIQPCLYACVCPSAPQNLGISDDL